MDGPFEPYLCQPDPRVLALLAHPDDETLLCGGTLALLSGGGAEVRAVCFADGAQGRAQYFPEACKVLGIEGKLLDHETNEMRLNGALIATTDEAIQNWEPNVVITHSRCGSQNQDHRVIHEAVSLSVSRWHGSILALAAEPPISSVEFSPNVFVDVSNSWRAKCQAAAIHRIPLERPYMTDEYLEGRARWWAQVAGKPGRKCESFELLTWR